MRLTSKLLSLPASILFLITAHTAAALHDDLLTNNAPDNSRQDTESMDQRDVDARNEQTPQLRNPVGIMKMSDDPSQKFYMHYWQYEDEPPQSNSHDDPLAPLLRTRDEEEEAILLANSSAVISYRAPFALHTQENLALHQLKTRGRIPSREAAAGALAALQKRGFQCPTGTSDCSAIGYQNSCCGTDETCFEIEDTGLGPVGCCNKGDTCGGTISGCDAPNTACYENQSGDYEGGGCCIPDYVCAGIGCIPKVSGGGGGGGGTATVIVTVTSSTSTTSTPSSTTKSTNSQSSSHGPIATTTITRTVSGGPAARPTGSSDSTSTPGTTEPPGSCPTGFYACEAYHAGGCCRTGRDCATTNCPDASSTTLVSSGVTIVVPVGPAATLASPSGACASGWSSCAASLGGNCCLSGYQCGTASCTSISPTNTLVGSKNPPNSGMRSVQGSFGLLVGGLMVVIMWI